MHKLIDEGKTRVVLDLGGVKFMNSSGLGMLIGGLTTIKKPKGTNLQTLPKKLKAFNNYKTNNNI